MALITPTVYDRSSFDKGELLPLISGSIIPFNKPLDWSSFDIVNQFRIKAKHCLGIKKLKVGHAGTLDPKATGLLVLCTGKATRSIESLMDGTKQYVAELKMGATTASFDSEQPENDFFPWEHITREKLEAVMENFTGTLMQQPPLFSATSIGGKRAYKLARKGKEVELPFKPITIHKLQLLSFTPPYAKIAVTCSRGTYIRSLARDMGIALQSGAYLTALERTHSGNFSLEHAFFVDDIPQLLERFDPNELQLIQPHP